MRTIKLMADYQCFPLWEASPGEVGEINPSELPISPALQKKLFTWASTFDATLSMDDPLCSGFASEEAAEQFRKGGMFLANQLQSELGNGYVVIYKPQGEVKR